MSLYYRSKITEIFWTYQGNMLFVAFIIYFFVYISTLAKNGRQIAKLTLQNPKIKPSHTPIPVPTLIVRRSVIGRLLYTTRLPIEKVYDLMLYNAVL